MSRILPGQTDIYALTDSRLALGRSVEEQARALLSAGVKILQYREKHAKAGKMLEQKGISAEIINMATIKPLDEELVIASAKKTGKVITVEEHNIIGGLGEAVCSALGEKCPTPVKRIGVNDEFGHSGPAVDLLKQFGLCADNIAATAEKFLNK